MRLAMMLVAIASFLPRMLAAAEPASPAASLPSSAAVRATVQAYFSQLPDYRPGMLVTRSQVKPLWGYLARIGWNVADAQTILAAVPDDGDPIVRVLRASGGAEFQQKIAQIPQGYDYIDQLLTLPRGQKIVADLVRGPGGEKMIAYLATTAGGKHMGTMLSRPAARDFNAPTARLYTSDQLLARLKASYDAARTAVPPSGRRPPVVRKAVSSPPSDSTRAGF